MAKPEIKAAIMSEEDMRVDEPGSMANLYTLFQMARRRSTRWPTR